MFLCIVKLRELINQTSGYLLAQYNENEAKALSRLIISSLMEVNSVQLMVKENDTVSDILITKVERIVIRLQENEPIQYILNSSWFYGYQFYVNEEVLIPRPETEELVSWVLEIAKPLKNPKILDVGSGSGCIPIAIELEHPDADVYAIEYSDSAVAIAQRNSEKLGVQTKYYEFDALELGNWEVLEKFDIIVSNPPYIPGSEKSLMHKNVLDFEPDLALFVENQDPLIFYRQITKAAISHLKPNGALLFECNEFNAQQVLTLMLEQGFTDIELRKDLQGKDRMAFGRMAS